jgi:hypothetical protein
MDKYEYDKVNDNLNESMMEEIIDDKKFKFYKNLIKKCKENETLDTDLDLAITALDSYEDIDPYYELNNISLEDNFEDEATPLIYVGGNGDGPTDGPSSITNKTLKSSKKCVHWYIG